LFVKVGSENREGINKMRPLGQGKFFSKRTPCRHTMAGGERGSGPGGPIEGGKR